MSTPEPAGTGVTDDRALAPAATLPDGTPHPDPFLAERGWQVQRGIYIRVSPGEGQAA
jgi:hypothetical protein